MAKWIGYAVSVNCGEPLGCYQGTILAADGNTITLTKAFRNGFPYPKSQVTLNAADIRALNIIETKSEPAAQAQSTVAVAKGRKAARATVCENLQANYTTADAVPVPSGSAAHAKPRGGEPPRSKPIDIQPPRTNKNNNHAGSYGAACSTPKAQRGSGSGGGGGGGGGNNERARRRNEACFGDAVNALDTDFDFEGNLALFDKRALWQQMSASKHVPDVVRTAEKLRHDENVLGPSQPSPSAGITLPSWGAVHPSYVTDEGVVVMAGSGRLRARLWGGLGALKRPAQALLGRATADVALRLAGGGRRLEPRNAHQTPSAVVLASNQVAGGAALVAGRLLAGLGARVVVHIAGERETEALAQEMAGLRLAGVSETALERLPAAADVIIAALNDPEDERGVADEDRNGVGAAAEWARGARGALVVVEGGAQGSDNDPGPGRASVCALVPGAGGRRGLLLADVGAPRGLWEAHNISYRSPFGARALIPLHPADDDD